MASLQAPRITWQLAQTFWVGAVWMLQFVFLPALLKAGFADVLVQEVAKGMRPLVIGFALLCTGLQLVALGQSLQWKLWWKDVRAQLLLAVIALSIVFFTVWLLLPKYLYWQMYCYLAVAVLGLLLVIQPSPK